MESKTSITNANAKISDSGYSNSCSNSISQRSSTSKSHNSESTSSRSSGYYGAATGNRSNEDNNFHPPRRNKSKEHKKRKYKFNTIPIKEQKTEEISLNDIKEEIIIDTNKLPEKEEKTADFSSIEVKPEQKTEESQVPLEKQWTFSMDSSKEKSQLNIENRLDTSTEFLKNTQKESNENSENGFCCVISLYDGIVLYTTPSLTSVLGFPKDMWLGRSFIDFVHPKDRETFSSQIATEIALPLVNTPGKINDLKNYLYVCLRKYKNLKSGFNISDKPVNYQAFQLTVSIQHLNTSGDIKKQLDGKNGKFLVVFASPVYSAYKVPNEEVHFENFGMRHTAGCKFSHVDPDIVKNLGFLPQDLLGKSIFDFYHPEDMSFLKEIYESIVAMRQMTGSVFRSKPYRFAVQNGGFVTLETEWSSFVNPWSRRMEYVIGLHKVLQGPKDPDVFAKNQNEELNFISDDVLTKSKTIQGEILLLLNKELSLPLETSKQEVFKRCKDLAHFMESLMGNKKNSELHIEMPSCISEKDFVMLGEISPHHDYYDSKSSSETPPSYNQLNYNDNIERFFKSKPKTTLSSDESSERPSIEQSSTTQGEKNDPNTISNNQKCESPVENSGYSGSGSAGNLSSVSNPMAESGDTSVTNTTSNESFKPLHLTEDVLTKHNKNMEQIMIQRHKEIKQHSKELSGNKSNSKKGKKKFNRKHKASKNKSNHGVKRRISQSWEGDQKNSRQKYKIDQSVGNDNIPEVNLQQNNQSFSNNFYLANDLYHQRMNEANLWPPFPIKMSPVNENLTANLAGFPGGMFPFYYIPTPQNPLDRPTTSQQNLQVQYFPSILFPTSPVIPIPLVQVPAPSTYIKTDQQTNNCPNSNYLVATESACDSKLISPNTTIFHGPPSQATSIKVEHGSNLDSVASASVVNKAFSVSSRKDLVLQSVCSQDSPIVSPLDGEVHMEKFQSLQIKNNKEQLPISKQESNTTNDDESWFSSSYSSLLKTDYGSGSNDESNNKKIQSDDDVLIKEKENVSLRKRHPPWLNSVNVTSEFIYQYQMAIKGLEDVLESDLEILKDMNQPSAINEQLEELYKEMELQGLSFKLKLEEGFSSSSCSSSGEENRANASKSTTNTIRKKKKSRNSFMKAFLYEENSSFPQSDEQDSNN